MYSSVEQIDSATLSLRPLEYSGHILIMLSIIVSLGKK